MPRHWMPMYWGDYMADTQHLTTEEHGAYLLLIAAYWNTGKALPDSDKRLAAIAKQVLDVWLQTREALEPFFEVENGCWFHPRVEAELEKSREISEKRSQAGSKGGSKRKANAIASAKQLHKQNGSIPQPPINYIEDAFDSFWNVYPNRKAKQDARKAWKKLGITPELLQTILQAIANQQQEKKLKADAGEFVPEWPYPATWLNRGSWEDEVDLSARTPRTGGSNAANQRRESTFERGKRERAELEQKLRSSSGEQAVGQDAGNIRKLVG